MKLLPDHQHADMLANGKANVTRRDSGLNEQDFNPVVKLFCPWGGATWLLTELGTEDRDLAFGLCDLGMGSPELGYVRLSELAAVIGPGGLRIERDNIVANLLCGYVGWRISE